MSSQRRRNFIIDQVWKFLPSLNHFLFVRHFGFVIINNTVGIQILDKSGFRILRGVQCVNGPVLEWSAWPIKYPVT